MKMAADTDGAQSAQNGKTREIIRIENLVKKYFIGTENELTVLKNINLTVREGEFVAIVGPSGSGKSTMMQIIGALDRPTSGSYWLDGILTSNMNANELSEVRNTKIGFVFQTYNLIARVDAQKNVELPMLYAGTPHAKRVQKARELLELVEMSDRLHHQPNELSGGQKQRVAIARAVLIKPRILVLDDSTSAVDMETEYVIQQKMKAVLKKRTTFIIAHRISSVKNADQILVLDKGRIAERGTHAELLAQKGIYYGMVQDQYRDFESVIARGVEALKGGEA